MKPVPAILVPDIEDRPTQQILLDVARKLGDVNDNTREYVVTFLGDLGTSTGTSVATLAPGAANTVAVTNGAATAVTWAKIVNANVDAAAAIAGTKVDPDFGSQNVKTTGYVGIGGTLPSVGTTRWADSSTLYGEHSGSSFLLMNWASGNFVIGATAGYSSVHLDSTTLNLYASTTKGILLTTTQAEITQGILSVGTVSASGTVRGFDNNSGNGQPCTFRGGASTQAGSNGADGTFTGGAASTGTAGDAILQGATASAGTHGKARIKDQAGNTRVLVDNTGLGFFGSATVAQPTVTGSRAGNAALASLLTALANEGLIVDGSSA